MSTIGDRIYLVRLAHGNGIRRAEPQRLFAERLNATGLVARRYDGTVVSRLETGEQKVDLDDIEVIAAVDPLERGRAWLAWDEEEVETPPRAIVLPPMEEPDSGEDQRGA